MSRLRVLMYHKVSLQHRDFLTVTQDQLKKQLIYLKKRHQFINLSDLAAAINGTKPLPSNSLLVTFDDGYKNNYDLAYPIFKKLNLPFSIFLVSDYFGKTCIHDGKSQEFIGLKECNEMQDLAEYAYHSKQHENIMEIPVDEWESHIQACKIQFESHGLNMQNFWAYTYGAYPKKDKGLMKKLILNFQNQQMLGAFRIGNRINEWPLSKPYELERIDVRGNENFLKFILKTKFGKLL